MDFVLQSDWSVIAERLNVRFGGPWNPRVLKDLSFKIKPGEIVCVIGPNGAGKTTLLNLLAGCLYKTRNRITIFDLNRWKKNLQIRRISTYAPAVSRFVMGPTPFHHFMAIGRLYQMDPNYYGEKCAALVNDLNFGMELGRSWQSLSLGQRHKAILIGAFLPEAGLRILDEPVASGIDPFGMEILGVWMKEAKARGETIIFSTQVLDRAHLLADQLLILDRGEAAFWGKPQELITQTGLDADEDFALNRAFFHLFGGTDKE